MTRGIKYLIRRLPILYTLVHRFQEIFSPARVAAQIARWPAFRRHQQNSHVIAAPGHLGFEGGIYNPGALPTQDRGVILLAKGQTCHWLDAVGVNAHLY